MPIALIGAALAIEIGASLAAKGLQMALPEIGKLAGLPELEELSEKITKEKITLSSIDTAKRLRVQYK